MAHELPIELWGEIISHVDQNVRNRRDLLPLQFVCRNAYAMATQLIYNSIIVPIPKLYYTDRYEFPCTPVPPNCLPQLFATFAANPKLAAHTETLIFRPSLYRYNLLDWPVLPHLKRLSLTPLPSCGPGLIKGLSKSIRDTLTHFHMEGCTDLPKFHQFLVDHPSIEHLRVQPHHDYLTSSSLPDDVLLPKLTTLEGCPYFWVALTTGPTSHARVSTQLVHVEINPQMEMDLGLKFEDLAFRNLRTLKIKLDALDEIAKISRQLFKIEFLHINVQASHTITISQLLNIPSPNLKYIYLRSTLDKVHFPSSAHSFFQAYPRLVIVDLDHISDDIYAVRGVVRFPRSSEGQDNREAPIQFKPTLPRLFESWWELLVDDVERESARL